MPRAGSGEGRVGRRASPDGCWQPGEMAETKSNVTIKIQTRNLKKNELMSSLRIWGKFVGVKSFDWSEEKFWGEKIAKFMVWNGTVGHFR